MSKSILVPLQGILEVERDGNNFLEIEIVVHWRGIRFAGRTAIPHQRIAAFRTNTDHMPPASLSLSKTDDNLNFPRLSFQRPQVLFVFPP